MKIKKEVFEQLITHAQQEKPYEACGYLAGAEELVSASYVLANIDKSSEHFSFDPQEQFKSLKDARAKGLEILAVYHSHLDSPAWPSEEDIRLAYDPAILYLIVSLAEGKEDIKAFRIKDKKVVPVNLEVVS